MAVQLVSLAKVTVTTKGTAVAASATVQNATAVYITAPSTNTGAIWVGDANVLNSSGRGTQVAKGTTLTLYARGEMIDLEKIFIDADNNNDIATITYLKKVT